MRAWVFEWRFLVFLFSFLSFVSCERSSLPLRGVSGEEKSLVLEWGVDFGKEGVPDNLFISDDRLLRLDLIGGREREIVYYSSSLPFVYILSPNLTLLEKLPSVSFLPQGLSTKGGDFLILSSGKEISFFGKIRRGLRRIQTFRLAGDVYVSDFLAGEQDGRIALWTIERDGRGFSLRSYFLRAKRRGSEFILRSVESLRREARFLFSKEGEVSTVFLLVGNRVLARGRNNWETDLPFLGSGFSLLRSCLSSSGKEFFALFGDADKGYLVCFSVESGESRILLSRENLSDFLLYDFDADGEEEIFVSYCGLASGYGSGREAGVMVLRDGKFVARAQRSFRPSLFVSRIVPYFLGIYSPDSKSDILLCLRLEKGRHPFSTARAFTLSENWFYRLSPVVQSKTQVLLKVREVSDLEGSVSAWAPLPQGLLTVGEGFNVYRWE